VWTSGKRVVTLSRVIVVDAMVPRGRKIRLRIGRSKRVRSVGPQAAKMSKGMR
jgi:hypothetical protein